MAHDTLYAIGEALIDMIPSKTGCSFAKVPSFSPRVGGAPANVCGAYARLGGDSALLTQLGDAVIIYIYKSTIYIDCLQFSTSLVFNYPRH